MVTFHSNIDEFFNWVQVALDNVQSTPEIATALAAFGVAEARLQEGAELLAQARTLYAGQVRERGEQYQATEAINRAWDEADETYSVHRRLVRLVFRNDPKKLDELGLSGSRKRSLSGWLGQATVFYTNLVADAEALAALGRYNVTQEAIVAGKGLVDATAQLNSAQEREKYEAQQATKDRDAALDTLNEWAVEFREIARIALADRPQQLEALQLGAIP